MCHFCIEALCDVAQAEIKEIALKEGFNTTHRYSPGYGDVPISHQSEILSALNAQKLIGLSVLDSHIDSEKIGDSFYRFY